MNVGKNEHEGLSPQERQLLAMIRSLGFGEIHISVKDGKSVRAEEIKKSVLFKEA